MPTTQKLLTAAAGSAGGGALYVEDVFSTFLYNGNSSNRDIVNGVDLTEGGLVWTKARSNAIQHELFDTERGIDRRLVTNSSAAEYYELNSLSGFNSNGFSLSTAGNTNGSSVTYASWTFRKAEKFFDVVTYSGSNSTQAISHNLGSVPAMILVKRTDTGSSNWIVYNQNLNGGTNPEEYWLNLDENAAPSSGWIWNKVAPTSTTFTVGGGTGNVNVAGGTYVAYIFASDAGGFGDDEDENIIKCGGYTADSSNAYPVTLGFEPQFVLIKRTDSSGDWQMLDTMRSFTAEAAGQEFFYSNSGNAEANDYGAYLTSTGFVASNQSASNGATYIYMAIRRPMKTPESGAEVFQALSYVGTGNVAVNRVIDNSGKGGYDSVYLDWRYGGSTSQANLMFTRFVGRVLHVNSTNNDYPFSQYDTYIDSSVGFDTTGNTNNLSGQTRIAHGWRRRPKVHDVVAWTGNGGSLSVPHALGVAPEIIIGWSRTSYAGRFVFSSHIDSWNDTGDWSGNYAWSSAVGKFTNLGASSFTANSWANANNIDYVAMLWSTLAGVSKCGSYSGNGGTKTIDCGFTTGPRYIMIRRTDSGENQGISTSSWWFWDYARGINAGSDPSLAFNTDAAELSADAVDPTTAGFTVTQESTNAINTNGGTYLFLAIA